MPRGRLAASPDASGGRGSPPSKGTTVTSRRKMTKQMLINAADPDEARVAVVMDGLLDELYIERTSRRKYLGNIYKGRVINIEPAIQAAFIDFSGERNGFLHVADLTTDAIISNGKTARPAGRGHPRKRQLIQNLLRRGQELLVQVIRDGIGHKGPTLTTYLSIPGRYLVLMPQMRRLGVSKKIEDPEIRIELRKALESLKPPKGLGFIVRTAGAGQNRRELKKDLQYLLRLWQAIHSRLKNKEAPSPLYQESDLVIRAIRDLYAPDVGEIIIDSEPAYEKAKDFLESMAPRSRNRIILYDGRVPLFHKYQIEDQIESLYSKKVKLKSGGHIVIEQTEAMVAIDVNSGTYTRAKNLEETAFKINMEAAPEMARQLRLRDLGGVIVVDFIDMRSEKHRHQVERALRDAMKTDRARKTILRMSRFCLVEITRQKLRAGVHRDAYETCPACVGTGTVKTVESVVINAMRKIKMGLKNADVRTVRLILNPNVAYHLLNGRRDTLAELEKEYLKNITVTGEADYPVEKMDVEYLAENGEKIRGLVKAT